MNNNDLEYAGFWVRLLACIIDTFLLALIAVPILYGIYGQPYLDDTIPYLAPAKVLFEWVFPILATIIFWTTKSATPGKMVFSLKVLDAKTGAPLTVSQSFGRYISYFLAMIPVFMGFIWITFDSKKQGWHDKLASTVVVRDKSGNVEPVRFE